jgi:hypothetical protein
VAARLKSNNSIGFWETTANLDVLNETMGALWWSYQQLGVDMGRCYTYCSIFPKGYEIKREAGEKGIQRIPFSGGRGW